MPATASAAAERRPKLPSLTGLRFLAALFVFFFHTGLSNSPIPPNRPINPFADHDVASTYEWLFVKGGYLGVSFFFVLSGFVLAWAYRPGERVASFLRRRVLKIFPNHLVIWVLAMVLFAGSIAPTAGWLSNLVLLHTWFPQASINLSVNPPTWSLGSEFLFYLSFPLLIGPLRRIAENRLWAWAGAMVLGTVGVQLVSTYLVPDTPKSAITPVSDMQFWFGYLFPPGRLFEFVLGILLARIVLAGRWPRALGVLPSLVLMAAGYGAAWVVPFQYGFVTAMIIPIGALIGAVAVVDVEGRRSWLRSKAMVFLGEISFGFYLCQGIAIFWLRSLFDDVRFSTPDGILVIAGFFAVTLLCGWLLYSLVERPAMQRWARSRKKTAVQVSVQVPGQAPGQAAPEAERQPV
ncbi:acyltransferase family protein [Saccharothrix sp. ST-888]|uniref:acyltransferase family protein n=1 Tax=Saccharothrix sp. ST-888 TaxID=1427391 RepID=UPI0005EC592D|nr:acyltransferase [Saccharothrix sp. ST-888]KJK56983.1 acyltransferase [Saccharothrix sp. ST-888]